MALRAWTAGWPIGVFQFTKSPKWKSGEEAALKSLAAVHESTGQGGAVTWHKMGEGWSWLRTQPADHERAARAGWDQVKLDLAAARYRLIILDEFTYPVSNGTLDVAEILATLASRPGTDRKSTRLNSSHQIISYAVFCLKKKNRTIAPTL